jgi:hypothetical protein
MEDSKVQNINHLYDEVREIIVTAKQNAVRSVDFSRVQMYWQIGRRILEEEQKGKERADYGTYLLKNLAKNWNRNTGAVFCSPIGKKPPVLQDVSNYVRTAVAIQLDTI